MSERRRDLFVALALLALGLVLMLPHALSSVEWTPDGLFYEAQKRELQGESPAAARESVFESGLAADLKRGEQELPPRLRGVDNPEWVEYSSGFYRRRWTVPAAAAAIDPIAGDRSLELISLLGFALLPAVVYLFLRRRFAPGPSAASSAFCALLPPFFMLPPHPGTDSWGLVLLVVALICALQVRDRGPRWLPLWIAVVLVLSFTRDATVVVVAAVALLAVRERSGRMLAATATGILTSLPAPLIFAVPVRDNLAYVLNDYRIPADTGWGSIAAEYPERLWLTVRSDLGYPLETALPPLTLAMGAIVLVGLVLLFISLRRGGGPVETLAAGSAAGAALTILLSVNYTELRLELVFLPAVAVGLALLAERWLPALADAAPPPRTASTSTPAGIRS